MGLSFDVGILAYTALPKLAFHTTLTCIEYFCQSYLKYKKTKNVGLVLCKIQLCILVGRPIGLFRGMSFRYRPTSILLTLSELALRSF